MDKKLQYYRDKKKLVKILRDEDLDGHAIHGFILAFSENMILVAHEVDFQMDGWRLMPRSFIRSIKATRSNDYCKQILMKEGLLENVKPAFQVELTDLQAAFRSLKKQCQFVIVEDEHPESEAFLIGPIEKVFQKSVSIRYFDGTGKWAPGKHSIAYEDITMVQFGCNYIRLHEKYIKMKP